jgi:hypothetical protein
MIIADAKAAGIYFRGSTSTEGIDPFRLGTTNALTCSGKCLPIPTILSPQEGINVYKHLLIVAAAILMTVGDVSAQRGGGRGGGGGGRVGGGGMRGGNEGGLRGGYGGYGRGVYGGYGGYGFGGLGYPYYGLGYGLGYSYPYYYNTYPTYGAYNGGYGSAGFERTSGAAIIPYSSVYPPASLTGPSNFSPPASPPATLTPATATVAVIVPKGGQVWFNESLSPPKNGSKWVFTSENLDPDKTYLLEIKARWNDGESDQSYKIPLRMEAGDNMTMDLTKIR